MPARTRFRTSWRTICSAFGVSLTPTAEFNSGRDKEGNDGPLRVREDVQAVMTAVRERSEAQIEIEKEGEYRLDLFGASLVFANLSRANLEGASLDGTKLAGADLRGCKGLTREQLDQAVAHKDYPPHLDVVDANTGNPLVWRGKSIIDDDES